MPLQMQMWVDTIIIGCISHAVLFFGCAGCGGAGPHVPDQAIGFEGDKAVAPALHCFTKSSGSIISNLIIIIIIYPTPSYR